jgi:putative SOS response-associated peptidase YedK
MTFSRRWVWSPTDIWAKCYTMRMAPSPAQRAHVHDRIPVILRREHQSGWIEGTPQDAFALCRTWSEDLVFERTNVPWFQSSVASPVASTLSLPG